MQNFNALTTSLRNIATDRQIIKISVESREDITSASELDVRRAPRPIGASKAVTIP